MSLSAKTYIGDDLDVILQLFDADGAGVNPAGASVMQIIFSAPPGSARTGANAIKTAALVTDGSDFKIHWDSLAAPGFFDVKGTWIAQGKIVKGGTSHTSEIAIQVVSPLG